MGAFEDMLPCDAVNRLRAGLILRFIPSVIDRICFELRQQTVDNDKEIVVMLLLLFINGDRVLGNQLINEVDTLSIHPAEHLPLERVDVDILHHVIDLMT